MGSMTEPTQRASPRNRTIRRRSRRPAGCLNARPGSSLMIDHPVPIFMDPPSTRGRAVPGRCCGSGSPFAEGRGRSGPASSRLGRSSSSRKAPGSSGAVPRIRRGLRGRDGHRQGAGSAARPGGWRRAAGFVAPVSGRGGGPPSIGGIGNSSGVGATRSATMPWPGTARIGGNSLRSTRGAGV